VFEDGSKAIPPFITHYSFMNSQEESLSRRLPVQLVAYHIHLRILHSGLTADQVLALPEEKFGQFIAECLQITRDAGLVPYQADETLGLQCTITGGLGLGLRGTEDMVRTSFPFFQVETGMCDTD
jgi:hypothetical protein